jgi:hypothetical protein
MCVLNGLVSLRFPEGPRGRIRAVSLGPYVAGVGHISMTSLTPL